ncbi:MAG: adenylate/guanylate cyclase domain-containing protein [Deltaproteobacteria bacterium]|nr:adenylate/guanylate cyclase domain-containing protein [Deltaproteobacteria bacterium]
MSMNAAPPQSPAMNGERKLAAIMFTDIVGFSRQMGVDETRTLRLLDSHNHVIHTAVAEHHGTVIKTVGDAFLVDFPSVVHAVQCAQRIQVQLRTRNAEHEKAEQIHIRIGIHLGDIIQRDGDVFGDGVNIASRLQDLAEPDTICLSDVVYRDVVKKVDLGTVVSLGKPKLKNIAERFTVYALLPESPTGIRQTIQIQSLKLFRRVRPVHRVIAGVVLALIAGGLLTTQTPFFSSIRNPQSPIRNQESLPLPDKPSIVVLPFDNMSKDPEQEYFSNGITEVLTADLSRIASLFVIARNTAFTYKGKATDVQEIGRELGVRYALEGSVQKTSEQVRIVAQLIDATTGGHLWSERYDRPLTDIFALQDEIVQKIVTTLKLQLTLQEQGWVVHKTTDNLAAYDAFLRGYDYCYVRCTQEGNAKARQWYEKAIALDPRYAEAYATLGATYLYDWIFQWSQDPQTLQRALELAQKAIVIDDAVPRAHLILGQVYLSLKQYDQAIASAQRAIALNPNFADAYVLGLAEIFNFVGRSAEVVGLVEKAMRLNPRAPYLYFFQLGRAYRLLGRSEEALAALKETLARNPNFVAAHFQLAGIYSELGREEEAQAAAAEVLRINPSFSLEVWRQRIHFKDPTIVERWFAAARKAGLK